MKSILIFNFTDVCSSPLAALTGASTGMIVCHCNGVSDRTIRKVVREGAGTLRDVGFACGAATCCGGCADAVRQILHAESVQREEVPVAASPAASANA
jgi:bacterioferritin-associated ferredoxin